MKGDDEGDECGYRHNSVGDFAISWGGKKHRLPLAEVWPAAELEFFFIPLSQSTGGSGACN